MSENTPPPVDLDTDTDTADRRWWWPDWPKGLTEDAAGNLHYDRPTMSWAAAAKACVHANDAPWHGLDRLNQLVHLGIVDLTKPDMAGLVATVWRRARRVSGQLEWVAEASLPRAQTVELFKSNGFTINCQPADRPSEPVTLYRGCAAGPVYFGGDRRPVAVDVTGRPVDPSEMIVEEWDARTGVTWQAKAAVARKWLPDWRHTSAACPGTLHRATVAPEHVLAIVGTEYVVDPAGLDLAAIEAMGR